MTASPAQAAARRRYMETWAPMTDIPEVRRMFVDSDLVGRHLYHRGLGIVLAYQYSFNSRVDLHGATVLVGTVVRVRPGLGIAAGTLWGYWADRLTIILPKGEGHAAARREKGRQP